MISSKLIIKTYFEGPITTMTKLLNRLKYLQSTIKNFVVYVKRIVVVVYVYKLNQNNNKIPSPHYYLLCMVKVSKNKNV